MAFFFLQTSLHPPSLLQGNVFNCRNLLLFLEDYTLLPSLACGGFTNVLQDAVVWFSSGGTKSVLHFDAVDNINCLFSGSKELFLIDKVRRLLWH